MYGVVSSSFFFKYEEFKHGMVPEKDLKRRGIIQCIGTLADDRRPVGCGYEKLSGQEKY
jgi:hypothetical protein